DQQLVGGPPFDSGGPYDQDDSLDSALVADRGESLNLTEDASAYASIPSGPAPASSTTSRDSAADPGSNGSAPTDASDHSRDGQLVVLRGDFDSDLPHPHSSIDAVELAGAFPAGGVPVSSATISSGGLTINLLYDAAASVAPANFRAGVEKAAAMLAAV